MVSGVAWRTKGRADAAMQFFSTQTLSALAGGTQTTSPLIIADTAICIVVPSTGAVKLPRAEIGRAVSVINAQGTNALTVFTYVGDFVNGGSLTSVSVAANTTLIFYCGVTGVWWSK